MIEFKKELKEIETSLMEIDLEGGDPLMEAQTTVESSIFDCSLTINVFTQNQMSAPVLQLMCPVSPKPRVYNREKGRVSHSRILL